MNFAIYFYNICVNYANLISAMKKTYLRIVLLSVLCFNAMAQDPQFSQFYAAPLYQNPAFTGGAYAPRLIANYRNQWPSINANYNTMAFSVDHYLEKLNSGIGIMVMNDSQGPGVLKSTDLSALYAYQIQIGEENFLRLGVQGMYSNRSVNYRDLTFGDQFTNKGYTGNASNDPFANGANIQPINLIDFSGGALFYNSKMWLGAAVNHISQPEVTFSNAATNVISNLPRKISVSGGLNIPLANPYSGAGNAEKEFSISPTFLYKRQGKFDQLDIGFYMTYTPITLGVWYRGIPVKKQGTTVTNHDALVFLAGFRFDNFSFGYSYDLTVSSLGYGTGGSHEISIAYQLDPFENDNPRNRKRKKKELSCPKF
jgi:type IX secretion system PorP/SprF family membrane protein